MLTDIRCYDSWYRLYDENGKEINKFPVTTYGSIICIGTDFFLCKKSSWYITYDIDGHQITTKPISTIGTYKNTVGEYINFIKMGWIITYNNHFQIICKHVDKI